jgi:hypothetical protein
MAKISKSAHFIFFPHCIEDGALAIQYISMSFMLMPLIKK